ncbi:MAG: enoyl-CoA hydratase-related protein [Myxococcota bacterium]|nr:enoyl-CoA hydratase-related protein [Myxococcota bacterium]
MTLPLLVREDKGVAQLVLNRPAVKNAIDDALMSAMDDAVAALEGREDLVAVVVTAAGEEAFCAGGDLKWLQSFDTPDKGAEMSRRMQGIMQRLSRLPPPVIGILNGYALGGGTEIALACDLRVMEEHSFLQFKQAQVGVMSGWGGGARLLRLVGYSRAMELFATGRKLQPEEALALGLTNRVVPRGAGESAAAAMIDLFRRGSARSIRTIKQLLQGAMDRDQLGGTELEATLFSEVWCSPEHDEAIEAFLQKRRPDFSK